MLTATIVALPKPGKDLITPQNFRPISLFNVDLKLYAKVLASRLMVIISHFIHKDQTEFVKGRQSSDATRHLVNITYLAQSSGTPSLLLSIDAEEAFDRVHWGYLRVVLSKFGFSDKIMSAMMASAQVYVAEML